MRPVGTRSVSWAVLVVGVVAFVVLAALLIPWHPYPGGPLRPPLESSVFTTAEIDRAARFSHLARWLGRSSLGVSLVVACVLGFTRLGRAITDRLRGPWPLRVVECVVVLVLVGRLVTLPFGIALQHQERGFGLSRQSWAAYLGDLATGTGVDIVMTSVVLIVMFGCVRRWSRSWPLVAAGVLGALVVLGSFVYPVLVEPLTTHVTSLPDGPLRTEIMQLAAAEHVHLDDVLVADASQRTTELNAYVSGFGSTRRLVLYDNLIEELPTGEVLSVTAHELGHARHDDVLHGTLIGVAVAFVAIGLVGLLLGRRLAAEPRGPGRSPGTVAAIPALLALFALGSLVATPVENVMSRKVETRADVAALVTTRDAASFVALQKRLAVSSLTDATPPAWSQWVFGSHPTALERIAVARRILG